MYFVTVTLSAQSSTVPSNIASTGWTRRTLATLPITLVRMPEPTFADIDALVGPATPQFAYQLRARVKELVLGLADDHPVRRYAEDKMALLDRLGHASSKAHDGGREPRSRPGWETLPSAASVGE
jgi:hypothetical protein